MLNKFSRWVAFLVVILALGITQARFLSSVQIDAKEIELDKGFCYKLRIDPPSFPLLVAESDSLNSPRRAQTVLAENSVQLPATHEDREFIQELGRGRYRHWKKGMFYFSTTDGSDPRSNGSAYALFIKLSFHPVLRGVCAIFGIFAALFLVFVFYKHFFHQKFSEWVERSGAHPVVPTPKTYLCILFAVALLVFLMVNFGLWTKKSKDIFSPSSSGPVTSKHQYYLKHLEKYDLVFMGDSRSYTNIHPHIIDAHLGTQSFNLAGFTHWFPTQYPHFEDLVRAKPEKQLVVWSIGHQNFQPGGKIQTQYPLRLKKIPFYLRIGFKFKQLEKNFQFFSPYFQLFDQASIFKDRFDTWADKVLFEVSPGLTKTTSPLNDSGLAPISEVKLRAEEVIERFKKEELLAAFQYNSGPDGRVNSVALLTKFGSYWLEELDTQYFRDKQIQMMENYKSDLVNSTLKAPFSADPAYWQLFLKILDLFKGSPETLIVNEIEEAPHVYVTKEKRLWYRHFMREVVQPEVEKRGYLYIRANWDSYNDADYFDYNHLNSIGSARYSGELADMLKDGVSGAVNSDVL